MKPSKRMWWALAVAVLGVATTASATTVKVDGVGDGDGDTIDDFDNISLALVALGPDGNDGIADVIDVAVDKIVAHPGVLINGVPATTLPAAGAPPIAFPPITDTLTINGDADGNGAPCVVVLAAGIGGTAGSGYAFATARFAIELGLSQSVTVRDLTLIPAYVGSNTFTNNVLSDGGTRYNCMYVDEGPAAGNFADARLLLERIVVTGADSSNDPVPTNAPPIVDATYWVSDGTLVSIVAFSSSNAGVNSFNFTIRNSVVAHGGAFGNGFGVFIDGNDAAASAGVISFTNTRSSYNGYNRGTFAGENRNGFFLSTTNGTSIVLDNSAATFNGNGTTGTGGGGIAGPLSTAGTGNRVTITNGGEYSNNFGNGILFTTNEVTAGAPSNIIDINGTRSAPILIQNNNVRGVQFGSTANSDLIIERAQGMIITGNVSNGLELNEVQNLAQDPPGADPNITFRNCIIANNRNNIRSGETNAAAATVTFVDSTFHNPGNGAGASGTAADAHIVVNSGASDSVTYEFRDCILSGGDATDRVVSIGDQDGTFTDDGDNNQFNFINSAIVQAGPYTNSTTLTQLFFNGTTAGTANGSTVNGVNLATIAAIPATNITVNPNYASTTVGGFTSAFLDVQNAFPAPAGYAEFPTALNNLAGGGDFLPVLPDASVTPTPSLPWTVTFFDNNSDVPGYTPNGNASVSVTAFSGTLPLVWTATNPQTDPSTVFPITSPHLDEEHWNISHNQAPGALTADLTLHWDLADHNLNPGVTNIHRFNGAIWQVVNTPFAGSSPIPGLFYIQAVGLTQFSPFALIDNLTLAVDLASLSAAQTGNTVTVSWSTAAELDNAGFVVYRANADGSRGEKLSGLIPAEGTATAGASYSFVDDAPFAAGETSRSYLLVDIDLAGSETNHGPATATLTTGAPSSVGNWTLY